VKGFAQRWLRIISFFLLLNDVIVIFQVSTRCVFLWLPLAAVVDATLSSRRVSEQFNNLSQYNKAVLTSQF